MWRGGCRSNISVAARFVWRCLTGSAMAPFPHPAHRTGQAGLPHPALRQDVTPSPTTGRDQAVSGVRARSARIAARVDKLRPCVARQLSQGKFDEISGLVLPATIIQGGSFRHQLGENLHSGTITHLKANKKSLEIMREDTLVEGSAPGVNLSQVARIVSSYLRHHQLGPDQLIGLIVAVPSRARRPRAWPATSGEAA
jgi:hypothetical protein